MVLAFTALLAAGAAPAQNGFDLPTPTFIQATNTYPFAAVPLRYQQWFAGTELATAIGGPVRITALSWYAGTGGHPSRSLDIEVVMAHLQGPASPAFGANLTQDRTVVLPRSMQVLANSPAPGANALRLQFAREFAWDGTSDVLVEIKIYGNGNQNQPFPYDFRHANGAVGKVARLYATGPSPDALSTATTLQQGYGIVTRFEYQRGVSVPFGSGCPGSSGVPLAGTTGGIPTGGNAAWSQTLDKARPAAQAFFMIGASRTSWSGLPLPYDLSIIGGNGCSLLVAPLVTIGVQVSATGNRTLSTPVPPVNIFVGGMTYAQWLVFDPGAPNGNIAMSNGVWSVFN